ncbi:hypothetical protein TrVE_jg12173 [Triparma verrucosa]|uniref:Major facilitator superfamily (MFS) profile domain-containing protein n=1 Tax=Triparma verrucosa TaxID=1606542 RepID=A0A9W7EXS9_9STRA|nr:hypothetical protein TrVE_jg12173 [Triparma verrucosa]
MPPFPNPPNTSAEESFENDLTVLNDPLLNKSHPPPSPPVEFSWRKVTPLLCLVTLIAYCSGSVITAVAPTIQTVYARESTHNYTYSCSNEADNDSYECGADHDDLYADPCKEASERAQAMAATSDFAKNMLTFFFSAHLGAVTDRYGRKKMLLFSLILMALPAVAFALVVHMVSLTESDPSPTNISILTNLVPLYYTANSLTGTINFLTLIFACLADLTPSGPRRAVAFGLLLAIFMAGISCSPIITLLVYNGDNTTAVNVACFVWIFIVPAWVILGFSETVTPAKQFEARVAHQNEVASRPPRSRFHSIFLAPFLSLKVLTRTKLFRILCTVIIIVEMVNESTQTLLLYYITTPPLCFTQEDMSVLMVTIGLSGIISQGFLLRPLNKLMGERRLLLFSSVAGMFHALLYAFADTKALVFAGGLLVCFTLFSLPTVSAIKSNNAGEAEQGQIQGAVYAVKSLAGAVGPTMFRFIYDWTKDGPVPGAMWLFGAALYVVSCGVIFLLPEKEANSKYHHAERETEEEEEVLNRSKMVRFAEDEGVRESSVV